MMTARRLCVTALSTQTILRHQNTLEFRRRDLTAFFAYPADIRRVIYTTNAVESLNMSLRKVIKTRGSFPNQEAAFKLLYQRKRGGFARWAGIL